MCIDFVYKTLISFLRKIENLLLLLVGVIFSFSLKAMSKPGFSRKLVYAVYLEYYLTIYLPANLVL